MVNNMTTKGLKSIFPKVSARDIETLLTVREAKAALIIERERFNVIIDNTKGIKTLDGYAEMHDKAVEMRDAVLDALDVVYLPVFETKLYKKQGGDYCAILQLLN